MENFYLPVKDYEGLYAVSDRGQIKSLERVTCHGRRRKAKILKPSVSHGYEYVNLSKDGVKAMKRVHRLVAEAFVVKPDGHSDVHHRDHNRQNNRAENLFWVTPGMNMQAASVAGKLDGRSRGYGLKLNATQVAQIQTRLAAGEPSETVARDYSVSGRTVRHIQKGDTWAGPRQGGCA